jgi:hypothetical protein
VTTTTAIGAGWVARDLDDSAWRVPIDRAAADAFVAAGRALRRDHSPTALPPADERLAELLAPAKPLLGTLRERLVGSPGFALARGFPVEEMGEDEIESAYLALGLCLGQPVSQRRDGALLARVEDMGADISVPTRRGHQSDSELPFHVDRADAVALLCVRPAAEGGESRIASAWAVHDILRERAPALLAALYEPLPQDRRGEERPGEPPWTAMSVFARAGGRPVSRYVPRFIEGSQRFDDAPRLTATQRDALAAAAEVLAEPGVALEMRLGPGDLQLIDNSAIWHARTAFADPGGPGRGRLLLRLWLATPDSPPLPAEFGSLYGAVAAGTVRGGVWPAGEPANLGEPVGTLLGG